MDPEITSWLQQRISDAVEVARRDQSEPLPSIRDFQREIEDKFGVSEKTKYAIEKAIGVHLTAGRLRLDKKSKRFYGVGQGEVTVYESYLDGSSATLNEWAEQDDKLLRVSQNWFELPTESMPDQSQSLDAIRRSIERRRRIGSEVQILVQSPFDASGVACRLLHRKDWGSNPMKPRSLKDDDYFEKLLRPQMRQAVFEVLESRTMLLDLKSELEKVANTTIEIRESLGWQSAPYILTANQSCSGYYFAQIGCTEAPCIVCKSSVSLYKSLDDEFRSRWEDARPVETRLKPYETYNAGNAIALAVDAIHEASKGLLGIESPDDAK